MRPNLSLLARLQEYIRYRRERFDKTPSLHLLRNLRIAAAQRAADRYFKSKAERASLLPLLTSSISTGAGWTDYHLLYSYIVLCRPHRVLEFGSGKTTVVMAHALAEAYGNRPDQPAGHLYSLEDIPRFHDNIKTILPDTLKPYVTLICSPKRESRWRDEIWGFSYSELPPGPFDLVFVDGPTPYRDDAAVRQGLKGVCLDLLYLLERDCDPVLDVVVDQQFKSLEAYQSVLPHGTVRYDPVMDVGVLARVCGTMLRPRRRIEMHAFELFGALGRRGNAWRLLKLA